MRAYSMDLRERVFADCQAGMTTPAVAAKYRVSEFWVRRLKQRHGATGSLAPHEAHVRELVRDEPDANLAELRQRLGVKVSLSALSEYLRRLKLSFKKS
jgi:transposase